MGEVQEAVAFDGVNLGSSARTDRGPMVRSVRDVVKMSALELDAEVRRHSRRPSRKATFRTGQRRQHSEQLWLLWSGRMCRHHQPPEVGV